MCLLLRESMGVGRIAISAYFFSVEMEIREAQKRIKDELLNVFIKASQMRPQRQPPKGVLTFFSPFLAVLRRHRGAKDHIWKSSQNVHWQALCEQSQPTLQLQLIHKITQPSLFCTQGKQDDLAIAMQLAIIGAQKFFQGNEDTRTPTHAMHHSDPKTVCNNNALTLSTTSLSSSVFARRS